MLIEKIDSLIAENRKARNTVRVNALQAIKVTLVNEQKSGKPYNDEVENKLLSSMVKQYNKSIAEISASNTDSAKALVEKYSNELDIIKEFAPKEASADEISAFIEAEKASSDHPLTMKELMPRVMKQFPTADGRLVSSIVKNSL